MIEGKIIETLIYFFAWWGLLSFVGTVVIISFLLLVNRNQKRKGPDDRYFKCTYDDD